MTATTTVRICCGVSGTESFRDENTNGGNHHVCAGCSSCCRVALSRVERSIIPTAQRPSLLQRRAATDPDGAVRGLLADRGCEPQELDRSCYQIFRLRFRKLFARAKSPQHAARHQSVCLRGMNVDRAVADHDRAQIDGASVDERLKLLGLRDADVTATYETKTTHEDQTSRESESRSHYASTCKRPSDSRRSRVSKARREWRHTAGSRRSRAPRNARDMSRQQQRSDRVEHPAPGNPGPTVGPRGARARRLSASRIRAPSVRDCRNGRCPPQDR